MHWYCLYTKPRKESRVEAYCRDFLGMETFYPRFSEYATIRQVRRRVFEPLFPRYFFCRFDLARSYRAVRYAPEALDLVRIAGTPSVVDDALIEELKGWMDERRAAGGFRRSLRAGDEVEITGGPLRGLAAVILHAQDDQTRVAILLSLLREDAKLSISRDWLKPRAEAHSLGRSTFSAS